MRGAWQSRGRGEGTSEGFLYIYIYIYIYIFNCEEAAWRLVIVDRIRGEMILFQYIQEERARQRQLLALWVWLCDLSIDVLCSPLRNTYRASARAALISEAARGTVMNYWCDHRWRPEGGEEEVNQRKIRSKNFTISHVYIYKSSLEPEI